MYPSDLTDAQWARLEPLLRQEGGLRHAGGRPRKHELRRVVDALLYVVKTGCQWRQLPANFPPWKAVHEQFRRWRDAGLWERVGQALREEGRRSAGRHAMPTVAIIDSQSAKTTGKGGARGYDAGKKIKGRKRHIAVDTQGNLLTAVVHSAGVQDRVGARAVLMKLFHRFDRLTKVFADGGYTGTLINWAREMFGYDVEVVKRNELHTFKVLPKRWIVERNFAWMGWSRRLSKDYELRPTSSEAMIWISFTHTLLRRT